MSRTVLNESAPVSQPNSTKHNQHHQHHNQQSNQHHNQQSNPKNKKSQNSPSTTSSQKSSSPKRKGKNRRTNNHSRKPNPYPRVEPFAATQDEELQLHKLQHVLQNLNLYDTEEGLLKRQETLDALQTLLNDWSTSLLSMDHQTETTTAASKTSTESSTSQEGEQQRQQPQPQQQQQASTNGDEEESSISQQGEGQLQQQQEQQPPRVALIPFGSYRLGVHKPGADMDLLALCPSHCSRSEFFNRLVKNVLEQDERIEHVHPIPEAYTPVVKFTMNGIDIDMLFARVSDDQKLRQHHSNGSSSTYIIDDSDLIDLDEASVRSLNGARVAQVLLDTVPNMENYRTTLRAVKEWAHAHGLYSNVLGFLGGINYALLVACVCKRNPKAKPPTLLKAFFTTFSTWNWPMPVTLTHVSYHPPSAGLPRLPVWSAKNNARDRAHLMPILTPTWPSMNSSYNVGIPQLRRLVHCLSNAAQVVKGIEAGTHEWSDLYRGEYEFFHRHFHFLQVNIISSASDDNHFCKWFRFVESRLRLLIASLENPGCGIQAEPFCQFYRRITDGKQQQVIAGKKEACFFIGLRFQYEMDVGPFVRDFLMRINASAEINKNDVCMELVTRHTLPEDLIRLVDETSTAITSIEDRVTATTIRTTKVPSTTMKTGTPKENSTMATHVFSLPAGKSSTILISNANTTMTVTAPNVMMHEMNASPNASKDVTHESSPTMDESSTSPNVSLHESSATIDATCSSPDASLHESTASREMATGSVHEGNKTTMPHNNDAPIAEGGSNVPAMKATAPAMSWAMKVRGVVGASPAKRART